MNRYRVQFSVQGQTHFGIVDRSSGGGYLVIADAVYPTRLKVKDDENVIDLPLKLPKMDPQTFKLISQDDYDHYVAAELEKHESASRAAGKGVKVGKLFTTAVGDGHAYYVVTKVNKKTVRIEWRSFQADRWVDPHFGYGGTYPLHQVERFVTFQEGMEELFGGKCVQQVK